MVSWQIRGAAFERLAGYVAPFADEADRRIQMAAVLLHKAEGYALGRDDWSARLFSPGSDLLRLYERYHEKLEIRQI